MLCVESWSLYVVWRLGETARPFSTDASNWYTDVLGPCAVCTQWDWFDTAQSHMSFYTSNSLFFSVCVSVQYERNKTRDSAAAAVEKRRNRISRRRDVLDDLYKQRPVPKIQCQHVQQHIRPAFSFGSIDLLLYIYIKIWWLVCWTGCWTGCWCPVRDGTSRWVLERHRPIYISSTTIQSNREQSI